MFSDISNYFFSPHCSACIFILFCPFLTLSTSDKETLQYPSYFFQQGLHLAFASFPTSHKVHPVLTKLNIHHSWALVYDLILSPLHLSDPSVSTEESIIPKNGFHRLCRQTPHPRQGYSCLTPREKPFCCKSNTYGALQFYPYFNS